MPKSPRRHPFRFFESVVQACLEGMAFWHDVLFKFKRRGTASKPRRQVPLFAEGLELRNLPSGVFFTYNNQIYTGTLASFPMAGGTSLADYGADIYWGDGTSSGGTVGEVGEDVAITASHEYQMAGYYAVAIEISDSAASPSETVTGALAVVVDPLATGNFFSELHNTFDYVASKSLSTSGGIGASTETQSGDTFSFSAEGTAGFTLVKTLDDVNGSVMATQTESYPFTYTAAGSLTPFEVTNYGIAGTADVTDTRNTLSNDLNVFQTTTATDSYQLQLLKGGDDGVANTFHENDGISGYTAVAQGTIDSSSGQTVFSQNETNEEHGGRVKTSLNYKDALDLVKCTDIRFSGSRPEPRRNVWLLPARDRSRSIFANCGIIGSGAGLGICWWTSLSWRFAL